MKIAIVGGTHGNEPVGIEVMKHFRDKRSSYKNSYECFWSNPKAFELKKRYVDFDLNRSFGKNTQTHGYEKQRAQELTDHILGHFDLCIDLHTTTSNMGLTAILNNTHINTQKACAMLEQSIPHFKLIEEEKLDIECTHLNRLCPAGITIEVGPVANNVISGHLVLETINIVEKLLNFDFDLDQGLSKVPYFKQLKQVNYPENGAWYIHPQLENSDFKELKPNSPVFINSKGETREWQEGPGCFPFFINEAAYLEHSSAFLIAELRKGF